LRSSVGLLGVINYILQEKYGDTDMCKIYIGSVNKRFLVLIWMVRRPAGKLGDPS
jgi:hypothetical protein